MLYSTEKRNFASLRSQTENEKAVFGNIQHGGACPSRKSHALAENSIASGRLQENANISMKSRERYNGLSGVALQIRIITLNTNKSLWKKAHYKLHVLPISQNSPSDFVATSASKKVSQLRVSGGQAPGGHNVICGLYDELKKQNKSNKLYGFLMGPGGLVDHKYIELTDAIIDEYRNTGGFDMIGSGRTKLELEDQFESGLEIIRELGIKAVVIIGGDDSNTNACVLAEYYAAKNYGIQVIGCPKTIDGDLKNDQIETSFGFDTACKTYAEVIGNIQRDANSARKYWHFIKLMGRSASHIALECALQCQPNVCIVSEEVEEKNMTLDDIVTYIANVVAKRAANGNNFGTVLIPEGLIEFIPAMKKLIAELNDLLAQPEAAEVAADEQRAWILGKLSSENAAIYESLPEGVAKQLTMERDPHGNVQAPF